MTTIDNSGNIHGAHGRFAGHVGATNDDLSGTLGAPAAPGAERYAALVARLWDAEVMMGGNTRDIADRLGLPATSSRSEVLAEARAEWAATIGGHEPRDLSFQAELDSTHDADDLGQTSTGFAARAAWLAESSNGHPVYEVTFTRDDGAELAASWVGPVGRGEVDPDKVMATLARDHELVVVECGEDFESFQDEMGEGRDDDDLDIDELDPGEQSEEWRRWHHEYQAVQSMLDEAYDSDADDDEEWESRVDELWQREPERISPSRARFQRNVEMLREYREFVGEAHAEHLAAFDRL